MKRVLICAFRYLERCTEGVELLRRYGVEIVTNPRTVPFSREELRQLVPEADAVITGNEVWDEELYTLAPKLKVIARFGVGVDNIDLEGAKRRGIVVCNAPGATNGVAELVVGYMIVMLRHLPTGHAWCKAGRWDRMFGGEVRGKRVGLLGYGRIPRLISHKLANFEVTVLAFDRRPDQAYAKANGVRLTSMEEILQTCDIVSLHLPAGPETRGIMDRAAFQSMKPGAYFINTSRGSLVDEAALYDALHTGRLAGAACDVFAEEPVQADHPLLTLDQFLCTPHWGSDTVETVAVVGEITARQVVDVLSGERKPQNWLNP